MKNRFYFISVYLILIFLGAVGKHSVFALMTCAYNRKGLHFLVIKCKNRKLK